MKVLVCGSRSWRREDIIYGVLSQLNIACLVHGDCKGADKIAAQVAKGLNIKVKAYPAQWNIHGRAAGPKRNQLMLDDNPDIELVVAFPTKKSRGTWDMVRRAEKKKIKVRIIKEE